MQPQHFLGRVESMRGLAALCVAFYHGQLILSLPGGDPLYSVGLTSHSHLQTVLAKCLLIPFNGPGGVALFFVISGFVLGLSLDRRHNGLVKESGLFLLRRALRIYPAFIASLLLISIVIDILSPAPPYAGASQWFNTWYRNPISINGALSNLFFLDTGMNNITWTLKVEMEMAVVFPFLYLLNRRVTQGINISVLAGLTALCAVTPDQSSLKWMFAFYAGLMLPSWGEWVASVARSSPVGTGPWIGAMFVVFGATRPLCLQTSLEWSIPILETLSASMILAYVLHIPFSNWFSVLETRIARKLGQISYSFYVLNFIVLYVWGLLMLEVVPIELLRAAPLLWNWLVGIVACLSSIPLAAASYRWVEKPFIELGRCLVRFETEGVLKVELGRTT